MNRSEIDVIVREALTTVLGHPIAPGLNLSRDDDPGWDSLRHIEVVLTLEGVLGVRFAADDVPELTDIERIVERVELRRAA